MRQPTSAMEMLEDILAKRLNRGFKRRFTGFLRMKKERTEQETLGILEKAFCMDTETARESLALCTDRKLYYSQDKYFILRKISDDRYRIETGRD